MPKFISIIMSSISWCTSWYRVEEVSFFCGAFYHPIAGYFIDCDSDSPYHPTSQIP